jgi:cobalt-zinc-cadmium efflux system outer membrane protein
LISHSCGSNPRPTRAPTSFPIRYTRRRPLFRGLAAALGCAGLLSGCALYHPLPLAHKPDLVGQLSGLRTQLPATGPGAAPRRIATDRPLDINDVGWLAVLNDPQLRAERGQMDLAQANLLQASLLPNPSANVSWQALLAGTDFTSAWTASLTEDVKAIITYHTRVKSAHYAMDQVNADLLWQEWQVAQNARLLALDIYWGGKALRLGRREMKLFDQEVRDVRAATAGGNLSLTALAPLLAAQSSAQQFLSSLELTQLQSWQQLDALLGLEPQARFAIARPALPAEPKDLDTLVNELPQRRPDLVALRLGYRSADEDVRTAILGQFPAFVLGGAWGDDTANNRTVGPTATFDLPVFDRNQGQVAQTRATRLLLHEQYQARLDQAAGTAKGLAVTIARLQGYVREARDAATLAAGLSQSARRAYAQGNLDQRSLADYETTALQRQIEQMALERTLGEARIAMTIELGLGLPQSRIAPLANPRKP